MKAEPVEDKDIYRAPSKPPPPVPHIPPATDPSPSPSASPFPVRVPRRKARAPPVSSLSPSPSPPVLAAGPSSASEPRRSTRAAKPPGEWWKIDHSTIHKYREPTPVISSDEDDDENTQGEETIYEEAEEYHEADAVMSLGLDFVYPEDTDMDMATALEYAFNTRVSALPDEPRTFSEAMKRPDADLWYKAATDEIQSHLENGTWELVTLPKGHKAIGCKWVFKVKRNTDGSVERYKARLVAKGFSQRPGLEYDETFASTLK